MNGIQELPNQIKKMTENKKLLRQYSIGKTHYQPIKRISHPNGSFEVGLVKGSLHKKNSIYFRMKGFENSHPELNDVIYEWTTEETQGVAYLLNKAIFAEIYLKKY